MITSISLKEQVIAVQNTEDELKATVKQQRELIARLENDILSLQAVDFKSSNSGNDGNGTVINGDEYSTIKMLARELAVPGEEQRSSEQSSKNMLSIVSAQRDRLHHRIENLEIELSAQKQTSKFLASERDRLHEDNVKLYEKIKFLQNYQNKKGQTTVKIENGDMEARYENEYERHLDPFRKFSFQERQRKYGQLRTYDKAALGLGQLLMSSGHSRAIFFFYLMFLHLLVFVVLYRFAYTESCQRDFQADCIVKFQQHMNKYHPGAPDVSA